MQHQTRQGLIAAVPVMLGYVPLGFAMGVLAHGAGLGIGEVLAMSVLVYAGSAQFIAVGLFQAGAGAWSIVITTFLINSRLMLMSASLVPYLRKIPAGRLAALSYEITDESYAVSLGHFAGYEPEEKYLWGLFPACHLSWIVSTVLGAWVGNLIPHPEAFGLDYALTAMFICLLVFQLKDALTYFTAIVSGALALVIYVLVPGRWNLIIATVIAATVGVALQQRKALSEVGGK